MVASTAVRMEVKTEVRMGARTEAKMEARTVVRMGARTAAKMEARMEAKTADMPVPVDYEVFKLVSRIVWILTPIIW